LAELCFPCIQNAHLLPIQFLGLTKIGMHGSTFKASRHIRQNTAKPLALLFRAATLPPDFSPNERCLLHPLHPIPYFLNEIIEYKRVRTGCTGENLWMQCFHCIQSPCPRLAPSSRSLCGPSGPPPCPATIPGSTGEKVTCRGSGADNSRLPRGAPISTAWGGLKWHFPPLVTYPPCRVVARKLPRGSYPFARGDSRMNTGANAFCGLASRVKR